MLRIRPTLGLGQAQPKIYRETGDCGVVRGGAWPFTSESGRPCKLWSFDELFRSLPKGGNVSVSGKQTYFFPTPQSVVDQLGLCDVLHRVFARDGLDIPWKEGVFHLEPGVFHPTKSWDQMVEESDQLRAGVGQGQYQFCVQQNAQSIQSYSPAMDRPSGNTYTMRDSAGKVICPQSTSDDYVILQSSFDAPAQYATNPIVVATVARWFASESKGKLVRRGKDWKVEPGTEKTFCESSRVPRAASLFGHSYQAQDITILRVGPNGVEEGPVTQTLETPILQLYMGQSADPGSKALISTWGSLFAGGPLTPAGIAVATGISAFIDGVSEERWLSVYPEQVTRLIKDGRWPPPGATRARWMDTQQEFDPRILAPQAPQQAGMGKGAIIGVVGIVAGIALIIAARRSSNASRTE